MKELHLVCNAHLDPVWHWDWNEGATAALATFYSACELADEYDYIFCQTEPTESGNYWHYDTDGKTPIIWKKEN